VFPIWLPACARSIAAPGWPQYPAVGTPIGGTANYLIGLGATADLEIIGPDPDAERPPRWFGLEQLRTPRLLTWAVHPADLDACIRAARTAG
jgi:hypothetical protein